jgi:hypothetical protein
MAASETTSAMLGAIPASVILPWRASSASGRGLVFRLTSLPRSYMSCAASLVNRDPASANARCVSSPGSPSRCEPNCSTIAHHRSSGRPALVVCDGIGVPYAGGPSGSRLLSDCGHVPPLPCSLCRAAFRSLRARTLATQPRLTTATSTARPAAHRIPSCRNTDPATPTDTSIATTHRLPKNASLRSTGAVDRSWRRASIRAFEELECELEHRSGTRPTPVHAATRVAVSVR